MSELRVLLVTDGDLGPLCAALPQDGDVTALVFGERALEAAEDAPDVVRRIVAFPALPWSSATADLARAVRTLADGADAIVLDQSQPSRDLGGWLAALLDAPIVWAVSTVCAGADGLRCDRVVLGGSHRLVHAVDDGGPAIVLVKTEGRAPSRASSSTRPDVEIREDVVATDTRIRIVERKPVGADAIPLSGARVVVSIGRGIGGTEHVPLFEELARRLGAGFGASRVAVDAGWVPFRCQVGQTGASVAADVYLAFGISGAIQHLAGMRASKVIVAVNTDRDAPLARMADLVVEGDAVGVCTALLERLGPRTDNTN